MSLYDCFLEDHNQQDEVDKLKKQVEKLEADLKRSDAEKRKYYFQVLNRQDQIEQLQQQATNAIRHLDSIDSCLKTYASKKAARILKGEKDD